ncbi:hypothetical protein RhiirC2_787780 [Rhizophagus irregularis]|uniref:Uncharacterized protein n=1 Tax=Rhizophagus irregularis TaxID=588596 RepID=A0A2N1MRI2_9GLOM|nr:hypothetical protein RhiirC2_787780 [Rhizophagus irregularis]
MPAMRLIEDQATTKLSLFTLVDEQLRTLVVTDIPLFVTDAQLRCYGIVTHCRTHLSKLYRTAYVVFESSTSMEQFDNIWAVLCVRHCLHVCSASHSTD